MALARASLNHFLTRTSSGVASTGLAGEREGAGRFLSPARAGPAYEKVSSEGGMGTPPRCQTPEICGGTRPCSVRGDVLGLPVATEKSA
jgi:hypothetical protein